MENRVPKEEILARIERLQSRLQARDLQGALLAHKVDVYYFSGTDQDAHLWIPAQGVPLLMVKKSLLRAVQDCPLEAVVPFKGPRELPRLLEGHGGKPGAGIGLELDVLPVRLYMAYRDLFPRVRWMDVSAEIRRTRMVKSGYELERISRAAGIADALCARIPDFLKTAVTETDLACRAETFYRRRGHPGLTRTRGFNLELSYGHIMAGPSGAVPSNGPGPTGGPGLGPFYSQGPGTGKILPHQPVLVDYAASAEGYIADQARIYALGALPAMLKRAHAAMLEVQELVASMGKPGVSGTDLYRAALQAVEEAGLTRGFMGLPDPVPFVGHGVGLEIDEWPIIGAKGDFVLEAGMVIALEPKVVMPGHGVVGIENTFVVTPEGMRKLNRFPDDICLCPA